MQKSISHSRRSSPLPAGDWDSGFLPPVLPERRADCRVHYSWQQCRRCLRLRAAFVTGSHALLVAALCIETVLLVNAVGHSLTALLLRSYVPGLIAAVVINLPVGISVQQRALREQWIGPNAAWQLIGVAIALHLIWHSSVYWRAR